MIMADCYAIADRIISTPHLPYLVIMEAAYIVIENQRPGEDPQYYAGQRDMLRGLVLRSALRGAEQTQYNALLVAELLLNHAEQNPRGRHE
jgi:hypothetical protein